MFGMTSPFLDLLQQIDSGITIYEPLHRTARDMIEFQDTASRLLEMERLGLTSRVFTQVCDIAGSEYYDFVMVRGRLTAEGKRLQAEQHAHQTRGGLQQRTAKEEGRDAEVDHHSCDIDQRRDEWRRAGRRVKA